MGTKQDYEFAAKAAGYTQIAFPEAEGLCCLLADGQEWNPEGDDGDSFRLMVKLHMHDNLQQILETFCDEDYFNADPCGGTRLAVFRYAVNVGRAMK